MYERANIEFIQYQEHISTLLGPEEVPALAHLINKPLTARELMQVIIDCQI